MSRRLFPSKFSKFPSENRSARTWVRRSFATIGVGTVGAFCFFRYLFPFELPEPGYSTVVLDRNGAEIGEIPSGDGKRRRSLSSDDVPPFMKSSLVALEDRRFFGHPGIDGMAIVRAAVRNVRAGTTVEGASTLEMGLARSAFGIADRRTYLRKIREAVAALRISGRYPKERIISEYLNRIEFGRISVGVAAAAKSYFGKDLRNLTEAEQLALLVMAKNPVGYDAAKNPAAFRKRFERAVDELREGGNVDAEKASLLRAEKLSFPLPKNTLPYVVDALGRSEFSEWKNAACPEAEGSRCGVVRTSADLERTERVRNIAGGVLSELRWRDVSDYGVLLVDRKTREVRVFLGGADYSAENGGQVNVLLSPRQVGSTLKPFVYLLAMERSGVRTEDTVLDLPVSFQTSEGTPYEPKNYSLSYRGSVTVAEALAGSLNVPAVRMAEKVGVGNLLAFLRSLGISTLNEDADHYGLSLALGTGEIPLYQLLRAYTVFSHEGRYCPFRLVPAEGGGRDSECEPRAESESVAEIRRILTNRAFKLREFGTDTALDFADREVFVKTGTSRNFRDNYAVGFVRTPSGNDFPEGFLLAVWSGNKDGTNMKGVSGATGAGEIFGRIVRELVPPGSGPEEVRLDARKTGYLEIVSPLPNSRYRFDPSVPSDRQTFTTKFSTDLEYGRAQWLLDGTPFSGNVEIGKLDRGTHVLTIRLTGTERGDVEAANRFSVE